MSSIQQPLKQSQTQQFLASQFCAKADRVRLQNLIPVQLHESCFQNRNKEQSVDSHGSPPHAISHCIKPSQKPQQTNHKSNMSLQNKTNTSDISDKVNIFSKRRDYSPNQEAIKMLLKKNDDHKKELQFTPNQKNQHIPMEVKESVAHLLHKSSKINETEVSSPKNASGQQGIPRQKLFQLGPYLSIQQQQQQQQNRKSNQKLKGHSSVSSMTHGTNNLIKQMNQLKKNEYGIAYTPTKFTNTTQNTEHSKSKSVVEDQLQYMKLYTEREKENVSQFQNISSPNTFLTTKVSLEQSSIGDSAGLRRQYQFNNNNKLTTQGSPYGQYSYELQESFPIKTCAIHKTKKAKYLADEEQKYYCSKCAVKLAGNGIHITEISSLKSLESQVLSFQGSSVGSNRQSSAFDQQLREKEMSDFIHLLQDGQESRKEMLQQLNYSHKKLNECYDNQIDQCNSLKSQFLELLKEVHNRAIQKLSWERSKAQEFINQWQSKLEEHIIESESIEQDFAANWQAAIERLGQDGYRKIIDNYQSKLSEMNAHIFMLQQQMIQITYLAQSDIQATKSMLAQSFLLQESDIPLFPQVEQSPIQFGSQVRTQPTPSKTREDSKSRLKTDVSARKQINQSQQKEFIEQSCPQNFCEYFQEKQQTQLSDQESVNRGGQCKSSNHIINNNLYISFENKDIFMNALEQEKSKQNSLQENQKELQSQIMVLQSYRGSQADIEEEPLNSSKDSAHSTPHSPASGQTKQSIQRTASKNQEFEEPVVPKDAFQKPKSTFRTLFENDDIVKNVPQQALTPTQNYQNISQNMDQSISPSRNDKFKNMLSRISNSQSKTQQFYQQIIQSSSKLLAETPDIKKYEIQDTETCKKAIPSCQQSEFKPQQQQILSQFDNQQDPSDYENEDDQEVEQMFSQGMKQSDIPQFHQMTSESSNNTSSIMEVKKENYQKALFCSPVFKDQDLLNVSDSSAEKEC